MKKNTRGILITGGAGYIGTHLIKELLGFQDRVVVSIDKRKTKNQQRIPEGTFLQGNIKNKKLLQQVFKKYKISLVIHLAGLINPAESARKPHLYLESNVSCTLRLLEVMATCGAKKIIYASSAAVYGATPTRIIPETTKRNPSSLYGTTKSICEDFLQYYHKTHGFEYVIFRYFNVAGSKATHGLREEHKPEFHLIPSVLKSFAMGKPIKIYGSNYNTPDGTCIRDYIHVSDVVKAHTTVLPLLQRGKITGVFNLGSGKGYSVLQVINECAKREKRRLRLQWLERRGNDPPSLVADCRKVKRELAWSAEYDIQQIIQDAMEGLHPTSP